MQGKNLRYSIYIFLLSALFFLPFLGEINLFDWDEINFAECAREMIVLNDYLHVHINFEPFWEKPPLFIWLQVISMKIFGITEYAARFPNAICGIITLFILYHIGKRLYDIQFGIIWVLLYAGSFLPHLYFKSGIIDPYFNLLIFIGLYFFIQFYWKKKFFKTNTDKKLPLLFISGIFTALAVLTKGPAGYLILILSILIYAITKRFKDFIPFKHFIIYSILSFSLIIGWYSIITLVDGPQQIIDFIQYQYRLLSTPDAGHGGFLGYHFIVLLIGCFPASLFMIPAFKDNEAHNPIQKDFKKWMLILFWVVLILFTLVKSKIVHYSSMCYFPLTYLAAVYVYHLINEKKKIHKWILYISGFIGVLLATVLIVLPFIMMHKEILFPYIKDPFALANLQANVTWTTFEAVPGIVYLITIITSLIYLAKAENKKGIGIFMIGNIITLQLVLFLIAPKVEHYSQRAAITFFKAQQKKDCYLETTYRSYAHFYYGKTKVTNNPTRQGRDWLLKGKIDKPLYLVAKNTQADYYRENYNELIEIGEKNGFVFFKRLPK